MPPAVPPAASWQCVSPLRSIYRVLWGLFIGADHQAPQSDILGCVRFCSSGGPHYRVYHKFVLSEILILAALLFYHMSNLIRK